MSLAIMEMQIKTTMRYHYICTRMAKIKDVLCCVQSLSRVQFFVTSCMDCSPPGSSVHGILQARILEWVAMPSCRGSF